MKRKLLLLYYLMILILNYANGQVGEWVWIHGSNATNSPGNYGVQGVSSPANEPPALYEPCEWTDLNGNFWMFGGIGNGGTSASLWKYNPFNNEWTWMSGPSAFNDPGVYGIRGIPSPLNHPPSKGYGVASWVDLNGNFWLFGGNQNDLWKYDIVTNEWTWMKGSNMGSLPEVYGTQGIPDTSNIPHYRTENAAAWTDLTGDLWFFGGVDGFSYNDLWMFNIATNTWTWMKGSNMMNQNGIYGTLGQENSLNTPGARASFCHWKDSSGKFWLFSGLEWSLNTHFNDLWRFNPVTNNWSWMSGDSTNYYSGFYGLKCNMTANNIPTKRMETRCYWKDMNGNFWFFGGAFHAIGNVWNDLWKYCITDNQWVWVGGDSVYNSVGSWGTIGVSSPTNQPNGRSGAIAWTDNNNHFYLFGGLGDGYLVYNDLWKFTVDTTCAPCNSSIILPNANFVSSDSSICSGDCINFTNFSQHSTSYQWFFPGGTPSSDTSTNPQSICYSNSGTYDVTLIATNNNGSDTLTLPNFIIIYPQVPFSSLTQNGDTLFSIPGYPSYVWYDGSTIIPGATNFNYVATHSGNYSVVVTDSNGCFATAQMLNVIASVNNINSDIIDFNIQYSTGNILLKINSSTSTLSDIEITDGIGKIIYQKKISVEKGKSEIEISGINLSSGVYFIKLMNSKMSLTKKIFIE